MNSKLTARTPAGARLVALARELAADLSVDSLRRSGYFAAPIPVRHGGLGVESVHDVVVASSVLAEADASVATAVNMHFVALLGMVRRWRVAIATGERVRTAAL